MTRRSELQRKLESTPAPKPPANLAERIKSEIPKDLRFDVEDERERLSGGIALNLRVAASILVLVATAYLALHVMSRNAKEATAPEGAAVRSYQVVPTASTDKFAPIPLAATEEAVPRQPARQRQKPETIMAQVEKKEERQRSNEKDQAPSSNVADLDASSRREDLAGAAATTAQEPVVAPLPAAAPPPPALAEKITAQDQIAPQEARKAMAKSANAPADFRARGSVSVTHFAEPATLPDAPIVDVEAIEQPFQPGRIFLRVSFDSAVEVKDLWINVFIEKNAAKTAQWHTGWWERGAATFKGSASILVEFDVQPVKNEPLVRVRARYAREDDAVPQTVERVIRRADVRGWSVSSKRTQAPALLEWWRAGADRELVLETARNAQLDDLVAAIEAAKP
jgi:hypothetical protein